MTLSNNYTLTFVSADFSVTARAISIAADSKAKVYGDLDPELTYQITVGTLITGDVFTGALARAAGESVGSYVINQSSLVLNPNYQVTFTPANLTISARPITVTADSKTKIYGTVDPNLTYKLTSGSLIAGDVFTGGLTRAPGQNVGSYLISKGTVALTDNYLITYVAANLVIAPASLTVKANDLTIQQGQTPTYTATVSGFVNGDTQAIVVLGGPDFTVTGDWSQAGVYTIIPSNLRLYSPVNYVVGSYINGTLTVNSSCNGNAKAVRPELECVEELYNHPSGFRYVAHFEYENDNNFTVTVPLGQDNKIVSSGAYFGTPPDRFPKGSGMFDVYFTGASLTWQITSCNGTRKTAVASNASSSSARKTRRGMIGRSRCLVL